MDVGMASLESVAASSPSVGVGVRPSPSKALFISSSSRWWMRRRWEGKTSSSTTRSKARPVVVPALFSPVAMEWQECTTELEVDVPCSVAYQCYSERENIPQWMPMISSVKLTVAYEVPEYFSLVASALKPFVEGLLLKGLKSFATYAKERNSKIPQP
ncbi:hypothetical protein PR202_ga22985 [Eleusine coracana subsp. coracana]|uniref:Coenzyme Q-binding protein COQ10 START domain-containing protein n=1 Tax=Eleusine coracana subsp. coracana TaxID=191504 RepID=A0AAV5D407_ELECO|nr:hypothetical protein PR202_ga22985 [Eleusine coracana subsp. coracana]